MLNLKPQDYDYLWTDYEVNFIFTSCYLFKEFRMADIILIYDWKTKGLHFFLGKEQRKEFSEQGFEFYETGFSKWKEKTKKEMENAKQLIAKKLMLGKVSDSELNNLLLERAQAFQQLGGKYFVTEFFFLEKAEKEAKKNKIIAQNLKEMGEIKFGAREVLNQFYNYSKVFKSIVEEIAKRTKRNDLQWLAWEEIEQVMKQKRVEKSNRDKSSWILTKKNDWKIIQDKEAEEIKNSFEKHFFKINLKELKGMCANKGVYKGRAKILRTVFSDNVEKEIAKVSKGDILIANTTGPEVMTACMKAGAIVTDEGGLTSHATIVSRELGIPCVVGCKLATKIFKDGDLIEVDAEKGIVRKVK